MLLFWFGLMMVWNTDRRTHSLEGYWLLLVQEQTLCSQRLILFHHCRRFRLLCRLSSFQLSSHRLSLPICNSFQWECLCRFFLLRHSLLFHVCLLRRIGCCGSSLRLHHQHMMEVGCLGFFGYCQVWLLRLMLLFQTG